MSRAEFCQNALQRHIAPADYGNVGDRIRLCAQRLGWSVSRTRDVWYGDYRIRINPDEMDKVEQIAGVRYARNEVSEVKRAIARADALLADDDENVRRAFDAAFRTFLGILHRPGVEG